MSATLTLAILVAGGHSHWWHSMDRLAGLLHRRGPSGRHRPPTRGGKQRWCPPGGTGSRGGADAGVPCPATNPRHGRAAAGLPMRRMRSLFCVTSGPPWTSRFALAWAW